MSEPKADRAGLLGRSLAAAIIAAVAAAFAPRAAGQVQVLRGQVFDFRAIHSDFGLIPAAGTGATAGLVNVALGADGRPALALPGYRITSPWRNALTEAIAPHLFAASTPALLVNAPTIGGSAIVDTYDSADGPYGTGPTGDVPAWVYPSTMPVVTLPAFGASSGNRTISSPATIAGPLSLHYNDFELNGTTLTIRGGAVRIRCDGRFRIRNDARLVIQDGATLTVYAMAAGEMHGNSVVNMASGDPSRMTVYNLGTEEFRLWGDGHRCFNLVSPNADLRMNNEGHYYGRYTGRGLEVDDGNGFHFDGLAPLHCGVPQADTAGVAGGASNEGIASPATFAEWFRDVLGVNMSAPLEITLTDNGSGVFEFQDEPFNPIGGLLLGNEGWAWNANFTIAIEARFVHGACTDEFLGIESRDDVWVFVDDQLAIDLGGVKFATQGQVVELDRLSLADGAICRMRIFYAARQFSAPQLQLRTNIRFLDAAPSFTISASGD